MNSNENMQNLIKFKYVWKIYTKSFTPDETSLLLSNSNWMTTYSVPSATLKRLHVDIYCHTTSRFSHTYKELSVSPHRLRVTHLFSIHLFVMFFFIVSLFSLWKNDLYIIKGSGKYSLHSIIPLLGCIHVSSADLRHFPPSLSIPRSVLSSLSVSSFHSVCLSISIFFFPLFLLLLSLSPTLRWMNSITTMNVIINCWSAEIFMRILNDVQWSQLATHLSVTSDTLQSRKFSNVHSVQSHLHSFGHSEPNNTINSCVNRQHRNIHTIGISQAVEIKITFTSLPSVTWSRSSSARASSRWSTGFCGNNQDPPKTNRYKQEFQDLLQHLALSSGLFSQFQPLTHPIPPFTSSSLLSLIHSQPILLMIFWTNDNDITVLKRCSNIWYNWLR